MQLIVQARLVHVLVRALASLEHADWGEAIPMLVEPPPVPVPSPSAPVSTPGREARKAGRREGLGVHFRRYHVRISSTKSLGEFRILNRNSSRLPAFLGFPLRAPTSMPSERGFAVLAGPDADRFGDVEDEDLPVADLVGLRRVLDRVDDAATIASGATISTFTLGTKSTT